MERTTNFLAGVLVGVLLVLGCVLTGHANPANAATAHHWTTHAVRDGGITINRHGVVVESFLHPCKQEDGSDGPNACVWNIAGSPTGNGRGLSYWLDRRDRVHYVWDQGTRPHYPWRWVSQPDADAFAEGFERHDFNKCMDWHSPQWRHGGIKCPNGWHRSW